MKIQKAVESMERVSEAIKNSYSQQVGGGGEKEAR